LAEWQSTLQLACGAGCDRNCINAKAGLQFFEPLLDKVRRTKHRESIHLTPIHQLAQDEAGFDRFANADIIRDQQAWRCHAKRHQQGDKLIGSRFKGELGGRPEGARATAER
jgi:hypothetical protein